MKYICDIHGTEVISGENCPDCMAYLKGRPHPKKMTSEERATEVEFWYQMNRLSIPFNLFIERVEKLVGRSLREIELRHGENVLPDEARTAYQ